MSELRYTPMPETESERRAARRRLLQFCSVYLGSMLGATALVCMVTLR